MLKNLNDFGLTKARIVIFITSSLAAAFFEGFGMAMFLPLLEYIENKRNIAVLIASSNMWKKLNMLFSHLGLEVTLITLLGVVLLLTLFRVIFTYLRLVYSSWLSQEVLHQTRTRIFESHLKAQYKLFDKLAMGSVVNLVTTETQRVGTFFSSLLAIVANVVVICFFILTLSWINLQLTLWAVIFLGVAGLFINFFIRHTRRLSYFATDANKDFSFAMVERLMAIRIIKLTAQSFREIKRLFKASEKIRNNMFGLAKINARIDLLYEPVIVIEGLLIFFVAINYLHMSLAQIGLFMLILLRLLPVCKEVLRSWQTLMSAIGSDKAVRKGILEAEEAVENAGGGLEFAGLKEGIRFDSVTFCYTDDRTPVLRDVNFLIPAGKMTALVGPSGAGKSTLVDLLPLLRKPQQGKIIFDDIPAEGYDLKSLRQGIAFVSQDTFIFNDTVLNNIVFACPDASKDEVWSVLEKAGALEFIKGLPKGLDTPLGERGVMLSGGQRQRIALARALIQRVPVLILDEPTSALDSEVEKDIQKSLTSMRHAGNVTIIVIAHRLSTIRDADKIVVLQNGQIIQEGTHDELMVSEDWYARIQGLQSGENLVLNPAA